MGATDGESVGFAVGEAVLIVGACVGIEEGAPVGLMVGATVGLLEGAEEGALMGVVVGDVEVGEAVVGVLVVGETVVGAMVVGDKVGLDVGPAVWVIVDEDVTLGQLLG